MSKAKTNALDALRALIAERQQYEQWLSALDAKKEGTPEHVFERVRNDYSSRLDRVVGEIRGHAEELQLSISALSSRLVEVARDEDTRREALQEAELRAAVGEYEPDQWNQLKADAESSLEKIASDRKSLDDQLSELRAIQKLSEAGGPAADAPQPVEAPVAAKAPETEIPIEPIPEPVPVEAASPAPEPEPPPPARPEARTEHRTEQRAEPTPMQTPPGERLPLAQPVAEAASSVANAASRPRTKSPPGGVAAVRSKSEAVRPDSAKTLKCPECGTPNYPTEWYCERCGGELATM
jgi:outer membrane biosynthesis protein TonB